MLSLFTLPNASTTLAGIGEYSTPIITDFLPFIYVIVGITLAILIVKWLVGIFTH